MKKIFYFISILFLFLIIALLFSINQKAYSIQRTIDYENYKSQIGLGIEDSNIDSLGEYKLKGNNQNLSFETIIIVPDTQKYSWKYPEMLGVQFNWIVENKDDLNIKFVLHEGDLVEKRKNITQWDTFNKSISVLDEVIPYSVITGNHDDEVIFNEYFPAERFSSIEGRDSFGGNLNNYQIVDINNDKYMLLNLQYCPNRSVIEWADHSLKQEYENYDYAIMTTHGYLDGKSEYNIHICGSTRYIRDGVVANNEKLRIVFSGHVHTEAHRFSKNDYGKDVFEFLADYQSRERGGNGFLRIMKIYEKGMISIETYSPYLDKYEEDDDSYYEFELD